MATSDFTASTHDDQRNASWRDFSFPILPMPDEYVEGKYGGLTFKIETANGTINVESHGLIRWSCCGSLPALLEKGLLLEDWLPGKPGNNKSRQTVAFDDGVPRLVLGNRRGSKFTALHIVIIRVGKKFEVLIPITEDQINLIERREQDKQEQETWKLAKLARERDYLAEWKTNVINRAGEIEKLAEGKMVFQGFPEIKLSSYSLEKVRNAIANLSLVIEQATPKPTDVEMKINNVIGIRGEAYRYFQQA